METSMNALPPNDGKQMRTVVVASLIGATIE
jgi:hypothetical protein